MKKSRRTYNGVHLNKKSNTQDVVEQSLTKKRLLNISKRKAVVNLKGPNLLKLWNYAGKQILS